jgi:phosphoglucomutase
MAIPEAGKPAPPEMLIDVAALERAYYERRPDLSDPGQRVAFGTSGHRGTSLDGTFTEAHILAITQAVCDYRRGAGIDGPILIAKDTHALSAPAERTALEVLAANEIETFVAGEDGITAVPVLSRAVIRYNRGRREHLADALAATPSHNPPRDGGFKYNPPHGGPAGTEVTTFIERRANALLEGGNRDVRRVPYASARKAGTVHRTDFNQPYVEELGSVIDMEAIRAAGLRLGVDPLGGASLPLWDPINRHYGLDIEVVNPRIDPRFGFMTLDHDGQIRMDCSSPYAMAGLLALKDRFRLAFGNDPDADRHGIVTPSGLMSPNQYLAVAIRYLLTHRPQWSPQAAVGKTLVSSGMIDRVVGGLGRSLWEVPVGFKWFAQGLCDGTLCFGGEESAGASFLQLNGGTWTTDKDGPVMDLLAAEITARTGRDPAEHYEALAAEFGRAYYTRIDVPATREQKAALQRLEPAAVEEGELAGEPILEKHTRAPGNGAPIGGLKVVSAHGWFAARPSGTESLYKIYAESLRDGSHLQAIVHEAREIVGRALARL